MKKVLRGNENAQKNIMSLLTKRFENLSRLRKQKLKLIEDYTLNGVYIKDSPFYCQPYNFRFLDLNEYKELLQEYDFIVKFSEKTNRSYSTNKKVFYGLLLKIKKVKKDLL